MAASLEPALLEQLHQCLQARDYAAAKELLNRLPPPSAADCLAELPPRQRAMAFRLLDKGRALEVFESLDVRDQHELLDELHDEQVLSLIEEMSPDDRVRLLDELPAKVAKDLLARLSPQEREATNVLLGYPPGTAGRIMTPEYVSIQEQLTVREALEKIRRSGLDKETVYTIYVTAPDRRLQGVVSLRSLVMADPDRPVAELMQRDVVSVSTFDDQEKVAAIVADHDLLAVPVVDSEGRLVGIVTVDDIMDVMQQEASEDIHRLGGVAPPRRVGEEQYFELGLKGRIARRLPWLAVLAVADAINGGIISFFEDALTAIVALAFFIPIIMDSAGNTGSQMVTLVVRALATGELHPRRFWRAALQELVTGLCLGALLGLLAFGMAVVRTRDLRLGLAIGGAMVGTVVAAGLVGTVLPFVFKGLRMDPAVASGPLITTIGDAVGLAIYFTMARLLYGL